MKAYVSQGMYTQNINIKVMVCIKLDACRISLK